MQLIQAEQIRRSKDYIEPTDGFHTKKIKGYYYLIKTTTIEYNYYKINKQQIKVYNNGKENSI